MKYILLTLLLLPFSINAKGFKSPDSTKDLCKTAVEHFSTGDIQKSFDALKPYWPLAQKEIDGLVYQTESQLNMASTRFGKPLGYDFVKTQKAGTSLIRHSFISKFENHAVAYHCTFYKPNDLWVVNSVFWSDKLHTLFHD